MPDVQDRTCAGLAERAVGRRRRIIEKYSKAEAEVVRVYFAQPHSKEDHIEVMLKQMGREIQVRTGSTASYPWPADWSEVSSATILPSTCASQAEEVEHYVLLADLAEWLAGAKLDPDRLLAYEVVARYDPTLPESLMYNPGMPEAARNVDVGREIVAALGRERALALMHLAEGGGGGAFEECAKLSGDEFGDRLAAAMPSIAKDEMGHGPARVEHYVREWIHSEDELREDLRWLDAFMMAHFRVRKEIWGYPLSEERIAQMHVGAAG